MLDKFTASANIALIIKKVRGALLSREFFENAMCDLFDSISDISDLMIGYDYFSLLIKKPKLDAAIAKVSKDAATHGNNLSREQIREICEIWSEAKFSGKTEADIAATLYDTASIDMGGRGGSFMPEDFGSDVEFIATDVKPNKRSKKSSKKMASMNARNSQVAGSVPKSTPMKQSVISTQSMIHTKSATKRSITSADIPLQLQHEQYREVHSGKLYRFLTGKLIVTENYYSTSQKALYIILAVLGAIATMIIGLFYFGLENFLMFSLIALPVYAIMYLFLFVCISRNVRIDAPFKWASIIAVLFGLAVVGFYILCDITAAYVLPLKRVPATLAIFVSPFIVFFGNLLCLRGKIENKKRYIFSCLACIFQMVLSVGYVIICSYMSQFTFQFDSSFALLFLLGLYVIFYIPIIYILTRMYARFDVFFVLVIMLLLPLTLLYSRFILYISMWMMGLKIEWYIVMVIDLIMTAVIILLYFNLLKAKYIIGYILLLVIYALGSIITGIFTYVFSVTLPVFPNAQWLWAILGFVVSAVIMIIAKLIIQKKIIPAIRESKRRNSLIKQMSGRATQPRRATNKANKKRKK